MNVTKLTVTASVTVAHPTWAYSNVRPSVELTAEVADGASDGQLEQLQAAANSACIKQAEALLDALTDLQKRTQKQGG